MNPAVKISVCLLFATLGIFQKGFTQDVNTFLSALIDFQPNGELSVLKTYCKNNTEAPLLLRFELQTVHQGKGGNARQNQKGEFDIKARQKFLLTLHTFSYTTSDILSVSLKIFSAEDLVASDTLYLKPQSNTIPPEILALTEEILQKKRNPKIEEQIASETKAIRPSEKRVSKTKKESPTKNNDRQKIKTINPPKATSDRVVSPQEDIGIDGLIIDETRTKMAHDFYDLFYRKWIAPANASDFIIYIRERPSRGRVARVSLSINEEEILQRNLSPRFELLEQQVNIAVRVLTRHLQKKESVKKQLGNEDASGSGIF